MYVFSIVCLYPVSCLVSIWLRNFIKFILVVSNCALISINNWEAPGETTLADGKHVNSCASLEHKNERSWLFATSGENAKTSKKEPSRPTHQLLPFFYTLFFPLLLLPLCTQHTLQTAFLSSLPQVPPPRVFMKPASAGSGGDCAWTWKEGGATGKGRGPGRLALSWKHECGLQGGPLILVRIDNNSQ